MEILVYPPTDADGQGAPNALSRRVVPPKTIDLRPAEVGAEVNRFVEELALTVSGESHHPFVVDEIEMQVTVSAEGKVQLVLGSASASGGVVIKIKLKRRESE
jgi:hypothetical protein